MISESTIYVLTIRDRTSPALERRIRHVLDGAPSVELDELLNLVRAHAPASVRSDWCQEHGLPRRAGRCILARLAAVIT